MLQNLFAENSFCKNFPFYENCYFENSNDPDDKIKKDLSRIILESNVNRFLHITLEFDMKIDY